MREATSPKQMVRISFMPRVAPEDALVLSTVWSISVGRGTPAVILELIVDIDVDIERENNQGSKQCAL